MGAEKSCQAYEKNPPISPFAKRDALLPPFIKEGRGGFKICHASLAMTVKTMGTHSWVHVPTFPLF